ncbi:hypothetical protein PV773_24170 [Mesorhizobium sp. CC13]|uniref:hypothetical protein n=1 Tax=Mesorhizobium sp. CC13 TaxID=3029194 RepID=UPI003263C97A
MCNETHQEIERIAGGAGWDSFTLILLIARWLEAARQSQLLLAHLSELAVNEEDSDSEI